ncbi:unnamed protein product [Pneumocystis jirovecii]|uniref:Uncharacterized protein n=1 Tax=Pneumocystis jirovecii TaxID=42068 RepID=L0P728_PNEJI|nr:unnamed protein product [Pneumocystis jirovecii]
MHQKDASDTEQSNVPFKQPVESIKPLINAHPRTHEQLSIPPKPARTIHSSRHIHIAPGYSTLDWEQLKRTSSSFPTLPELQLHNQINDAWIALKCESL